MRPIVKRSLDLTQRVVGALLMGLGAPATQLGVGTWGYLCLCMVCSHVCACVCVHAHAHTLLHVSSFG